MLSDDFSKQTMFSYLKAHLTKDPADIKSVLEPEEYFNDLTRGILKAQGAYVDCGAFTGDTVEGFVNFVGDNYTKIFAVEADAVNFSKLKNFVEQRRYKNVVPINCGVWNVKGKISFATTGGVGSKISENAENVIETDTMTILSAAKKSA